MWRARPGPTLAVVLPLLVAGSCAFLAGVVTLGVSGFRTVSDSPVLAAPGAGRVDLGARTYVILELTGSRSGGFGFSFSQNRPPVVGPDEITVTGPDGSRPAVRADYGAETLSRGSLVYTGVAAFDARSAGTYLVEVASPSPTRVMVAPSIPGVLREHLVWVILLGGGVVAVGAGTVMLVVGLVRRSRAAERARLHFLPPYGPPGGGPASRPPPF